ncbi:MAG: hypothetical protein ACOZEN_01045 [Thermodesulfobacteriota bacterium]
MTASGFELTCEIRHGSDISFEEVGEVENEIRERLDRLLAPLEPAYVDMRVTGDDFGFVSSVRAGGREELRQVCWELASMVDPGARGRLVAVEAGFGPVVIWRFSASGVDEHVAQAAE